MTNSARMFLRPHQRSKDGKDHIYWSLVETVRTADGPHQRTLCYLGELNGSARPACFLSMPERTKSMMAMWGPG